MRYFSTMYIPLTEPSFLAILIVMIVMDAMVRESELFSFSIGGMRKSMSESVRNISSLVR